MGFKKKQTKVYNRDIRSTNLKTRVCQHLSDNCDYLTEKIDASKMSENFYNFFTLKQNIFNTTKKFWMRMLKVIQQKENFIGEYVCYDISNLENNEDLNHHYKNFITELTYDKTPYINSESHEEYYGLVNKLLCSVESFLSSPLFSLENNIEHLLFTIDMPLKFDETEIEKKFEEKNVGQYINQEIIDFLKELKNIIFHLKVLDGPDSLAKKKELVENIIVESLKAKQHYLEKYESNNNVINPYKPTNSAIKLLPEPKNASNHFTNQSFNIFEKNNSTNNIDDYTFKSIVNDFNKSLKDDASNISMTRHLDEAQSTFKKNEIAIVTVFLFISLILFIVICVKKYFKRKNDLKNEPVRYETEPFYDLFSFYFLIFSIYMFYWFKTQTL